MTVAACQLTSLGTTTAIAQLPIKNFNLETKTLLHMLRSLKRNNAIGLDRKMLFNSHTSKTNP